MGHFNEITSPTVKHESSFSKSRESQFLHMMIICNLVDLGYHGLGFTWQCHIHGTVWYWAKRLDRALSNLDRHIVGCRTCVISRNSTILGFCRKHAIVGGRHFRFEAAWTTHPSYQELVSGGDKRRLEAGLNVVQRCLESYMNEAFLSLVLTS
ncbi:hypothetical protein DKX38_017519 [Salix brachista]|uniref:Uncharacterized protein n=1 Tax=Salix brachista TaxID=2182728 RepID=A0A5N5KVG3_9ROSI|nr:hypothetical protein DKX38_017519 [Salix brachista]